MAQTTSLSEPENARSMHGKNLCLLALDGGGVRGRSSLQIIRHIMELINPENPPKPCDYFDMIGGTSTGGLIALMLGRLGMTIDECTEAYDELSPDIFTQAHHRMNWQGKVQGRFNHEAIKAGVKKMLKDCGLDEDALLRDASKSASKSACKTFVCATSKQTRDTVILSSYFSKRRGSDLLNITRIWEAARATSAASSFFDTIEIGDEEFVDGATGANNPINALWMEAADQFREGPDWKLEDNVQCVVSVGTGVPSLEDFGDDPLKIAGSLLAIATDTEHAAEDFQRHHSSLFTEHRMFRFNVPKGLEKVGLEEYKKRKEIIAATRKYIQTEDIFLQISACAQNLSEREWLRLVGQSARFEVQRILSDLKAHQELLDKGSSTRSLEWFTNTSVYDMWLQQDVSFLWYPITSASRKFQHTSIAASLSVDLSTRASAGVAVFYSRCSQNRLSEQGTSFVGPNEILWSLCSQVLLSSYNKEAQINAAIMRLPALKKHKKAPLTSLPESVELLMDLLRSRPKIESHLHNIIILDRVEYIKPSELPSLLQELRRFQKEMTNTGSKYHLLFTGEQDANEGIRGVFETIQAIDESTECNDCLGSLHFREMHIRRNQVKNSESGTNQWVWSHNSYLRWERNPSSLLWIQGKPGSGKSVLAKIIQERLSSTLSEPAQPEQGLDPSPSRSTPIVTDWFFTARSGPIGRSHKAMLQSLLFQILEQDRDLFQYYEGDYRKIRTTGRTNGLSGRQCEWSNQILQDVFLRIASSSRVTEINCVVDGMDESEDDREPEKQQSATLSFFLFLISSAAVCHIKIILLSRPVPNIERKLKHCYQIKLEDENQSDLKKIVEVGICSIRSKMQSFQSSDEDSHITVHSSKRSPNMSRSKLSTRRIKRNQSTEERDIDEMRKYLVQHANGVVLWVTLVIDSLQRCIEKGLFTFSELKAKLRSLPLGLYELYRHILTDLAGSHSEEDVVKAHKILSWVSGAASTRSFQLQHLWDALAIPADLGTALCAPDDPVINNRMQIHSWNHFRRSLYEFCGPLVEVIRPPTLPDAHEFLPNQVGPSHLVQFLHQSVHEFLASPEAAGSFHVSPVVAQEMVRGASLRYLQFSLPAVPTSYAPSLAIDEKGDQPTNHDLVSYLDDKLFLTYVLADLSYLKPKIPSAYCAHLKKSTKPNHALWPLSDALQEGNSFGWGVLESVEVVGVVEHVLFACRQGYVNAVEILLSIAMFSRSWWGTIRPTVLSCAFLVAIERELLPTVKRVYAVALAMESPYFVTLLVHHYVMEAAGTGNEALTMFLYDELARLDEKRASLAENQIFYGENIVFPHEFRHKQQRPLLLEQVREVKTLKANSLGYESRVEDGTAGDESVQEAIEKVLDFWSENPVPHDSVTSGICALAPTQKHHLVKFVDYFVRSLERGGLMEELHTDSIDGGNEATL